MGSEYFGGGGMFLFPILFLAALVWVTYLIVRQGNVGQPRESHRTGDAETRESPMELVKRRYARGEINKEEFQEMKKELAD